MVDWKPFKLVIPAPCVVNPVISQCTGLETCVFDSLNYKLTAQTLTTLRCLPQCSETNLILLPIFKNQIYNGKWTFLFFIGSQYIHKWKLVFNLPALISAFSLQGLRPLATPLAIPAVLRVLTAAIISGMGSSVAAIFWNSSLAENPHGIVSPLEWATSWHSFSNSGKNCRNRHNYLLNPDCPSLVLKLLSRRSGRDLGTKLALLVKQT